MSEKRSVFSMPLLYGIARGDCLYLFCFCASLPHMSICARIIIAVAFQKIDDAPNAKTTAKRRNERLKDIDCGIEKLHI